MKEFVGKLTVPPGSVQFDFDVGEIKSEFSYISGLKQLASRETSSEFTALVTYNPEGKIIMQFFKENMGKRIIEKDLQIGIVDVRTENIGYIR